MLTEDTLNASLPHRNEEVRQAIASSFIGVTTWQCVCKEPAVPSHRLLQSAETDAKPPKHTALPFSLTGSFAGQFGLLGISCL